MPDSPEVAPTSRSRAVLWLFVLVFAGGVVVRLMGVGFGVPIHWAHPAETPIVAEAVFLAAGDSDIHLQEHPAGVPILQTVFLRGLDHRAFGVSPTSFHRRTRWLTVIAAAVTLLLAGAIGNRLAGPWAACASVAILAFSPIHSLHSHYATVDVVATMFFAACLFFSLGCDGGGVSRRNLLIAAMMAGAAAACRHSHVVALAMPVALTLSSPSKFRSLVATFLAFAGGLVILSPSMILQSADALPAFGSMFGSEPGDGLGRAARLKAVLFDGGAVIPTSAGLLGFLVLRGPHRVVIIVGAAAVLILAMIPGSGMPNGLIPISIVFAAAGGAAFARFAPRGGAARMIVLVLIMAWPAYTCFVDANRLGKSDSRGALMAALRDPKQIPTGLPVLVAASRHELVPPGWQPDRMVTRFNRTASSCAVRRRIIDEMRPPMPAEGSSRGPGMTHDVRSFYKAVLRKTVRSLAGQEVIVIVPVDADEPDDSWNRWLLGFLQSWKDRFGIGEILLEFERDLGPRIVVWRITVPKLP